MNRIVTAAFSLGVGVLTLGACSHMNPFDRTSSPETTRCPNVATSSQTGSVTSPPSSGSSNMPSAASPGQGIGTASTPVPGTATGAGSSGAPASGTGAAPTC